MWEGLHSLNVLFSKNRIVVSLQSFKRNRKKNKLNKCNANFNNEVLLLASVVMWLHIFQFTLIHCIALPSFSFRNITDHAPF